MNLLIRFWLFILLVKIAISCFDASGTLSQVGFAHKAAQQGGTILITRNSKSIVSVCFTRRKEVLTKGTKKNVNKVSNSLAVAATGVYSDAVHLTDKVFSEVVDSQSLFGSDPSTSRLASMLTEYIHERTIYSNNRPFGVSLGIFGIDSTVGPKIFEIDAFGNCYDCKCCFLGRYGNKAFLNFKTEENEDESQGIEDLISDCINCLKKTICELEDENETPKSNEVDIFILGENLPFYELKENEKELIINGDFSEVKKLVSKLEGKEVL